MLTDPKIFSFLKVSSSSFFLLLRKGFKLIKDSSPSFVCFHFFFLMLQFLSFSFRCAGHTRIIVGALKRWKSLQRCVTQVSIVCHSISVVFVACALCMKKKDGIKNFCFHFINGWEKVFYCLTVRLKHHYRIKKFPFLFSPWKDEGFFKNDKIMFKISSREDSEEFWTAAIIKLSLMDESNELPHVWAFFGAYKSCWSSTQDGNLNIRLS